MPAEDSYAEVLANRSFRTLWLGQGLFWVGQSITYVAVALWVYELTGSAGEVSLAVALELLPWVVVGPLVGALSDALERKPILVAGYLVQAGLVALLPFTGNLAQVYVLVFLSSLMAPMTRIAWAAALPAITGQRLFVRGSSLDIAAINMANVVGPVLAGWLVTLVGARSTFWVVVGCLLAAALLSLRARMPRPTAEPRSGAWLPSIGRDLRDGLRFLAASPALSYVVLLNCIASFGWSAPSIAAVAYLSDTLGLGGREYGLLRGTVSLSMALGAYVLGRYYRAARRRQLLVGGVVLAGLAYMAVLAEPAFVPLLGLWLASGLGWAAMWLTTDTLFAQITPDPLRGRVYSLADAAIHSAEVGTALLGGWLVTAWGSAAAFFAIGLTICIGSIALSAASRGFRIIADLGRSEP